MDPGDDEREPAPDPDLELELYAALAARLKQAHALVRALDVPDQVSVALTRRLLVITSAAKRDLVDAAMRLDRLMADLDAGRLPGPADPRSP